MIEKLTTIAALASLSLAGASIAEAQETKDTFSIEYLKEVAADLSATNLVEGDAGEGRKALKFETNGLPVVTIIDACTDGKDCKGLIIMVAFKRGEQGIPLNVVNEFNGKHPFVTASLHEPDIAVVSHAMISVGGVTRENVKANVQELQAGVAKFVSTVRSQLVASGPGGVMRPVVYGAGELRPIVLTPAQLAKIRVERARAR
jgi:hypothetical protein